VRRCLGAAFATFEMRVVLREILRRTKLRAASPEPEQPRVQNVTVIPERGSMVVLEKRLEPPSSPAEAAEPAVATAGHA
jgi:cytochrome P450